MAKDRMPIQIMCLSRLAVTGSCTIAFAMKTTQHQTNEKKIATNAPMQTAKKMVMRKCIFVSFYNTKIRISRDIQVGVAQAG